MIAEGFPRKKKTYGKRIRNKILLHKEMLSQFVFNPDNILQNLSLLFESSLQADIWVNNKDKCSHLYCHFLIL